MPSTSEYQLIQHPDALLQMVEVLAAEPRLAVDTESNSLYVYREQVCLIQFSTPSEDYLVDPLALPVLTPLARLFSEPQREIVFHAAEYDVLCLKRDFAFTFCRLFDTMLAARILGKTELGLAGLLNLEFGITLNKHNQRANWGKRPLSRSMLEYAHLDTHYLLDLRDSLARQLEEKNLTELAQEDFKRMAHLRVPPHPNPDSAWNIANPREMEHHQAAILQSLLDFRDKQARCEDVPPFRILSNQVLVQITREDPKDLESLAAIKGMTNGLVQRFGMDLLRALDRGHKAPPLPYPNHKRPPAATLKRLDRLRAWRKKTAQNLGVESDVILPRDVMLQVAEHNPTSAEELAELFKQIPWRLEKFGSQILNLL